MCCTATRCTGPLWWVWIACLWALLVYGKRLRSIIQTIRVLKPQLQLHPLSNQRKLTWMILFLILETLRMRWLTKCGTMNIGVWEKVIWLPSNKWFKSMKQPWKMSWVAIAQADAWFSCLQPLTLLKHWIIRWFCSSHWSMAFKMAMWIWPQEVLVKP